MLCSNCFFVFLFQCTFTNQRHSLYDFLLCLTDWAYMQGAGGVYERVIYGVSEAFAVVLIGQDCVGADAHNAFYLLLAIEEGRHLFTTTCSYLAYLKSESRTDRKSLPTHGSKSQNKR